MWDFFSDALEVARENGLGPSAIASVLVLGAIAYFGGHGFKLAIQNVRSLLEQSETLRKNIGEQLAAAHRRLDQQADEMDELRRNLLDAENRSVRLSIDLTRLRAQYTVLEAEADVMRERLSSRGASA